MIVLKAIVVLTWMLLNSQNAWAYIDPGVGSYFYQLLLAALFAFLFTLKVYWRHLVDLLSKLFKSKKKKSQ